MKRSWTSDIGSLMLVMMATLSAATFAQEPSREELRDILRREAAKTLSGVHDVDDYLDLMGLMRSFQPDAVLQKVAQADISKSLRTLFRGWAYHQKGDYRKALASFNDLSESDPDLDEFLANRLVELRQSATALADFKVHESENFSLRYQDGRDEVMLYFLPEILEAAYARLGDLFHYRRDEKIIVELMPDYELFSFASALTKTQIETTGTVALCVENRLVVLTPRRVALGYYWPNVIAHEFIHYIMTKLGGESIPLWFHEGVAKYMEGRWEAEIQPPLEEALQSKLAEALEMNQFVTFEQMYPSFAALPTPHLAQLAYAETASMIEFLCDQQGTDYIPNLLGQIGPERGAETLIQETFATDMEGFLEKWKAWAKTRNYQKSAAEMDDGAVTLLDKDFEDRGVGELNEADEVLKKHTRLGDLLMERHRYKPAIKEYVKAIDDQNDGLSRQMILRFLTCYEHLQQGQPMLKLIDEQVGKWKMDPTMLKYRAVAYMLLDDTAQAKAMLIQAVRVNPYDPKVHELRRRVAETDGDLEAIEQIQAILEILSHKPVPQDPSKS